MTQNTFLYDRKSADKMPDSEQERQIYKYVLENEIQKLRLRQKKIRLQTEFRIKSRIESQIESRKKQFVNPTGDRIKQEMMYGMKA